VKRYLIIKWQIQQTEATRSLLQSQEYRQSFFEGGLGAYTNLIAGLLETGKPEDAFNYGERARSRTFLDVLGRQSAARPERHADGA